MYTVQAAVGDRYNNIEVHLEATPYGQPREAWGMDDSPSDDDLQRDDDDADDDSSETTATLLGHTVVDGSETTATLLGHPPSCHDGPVRQLLARLAASSAFGEGGHNGEGPESLDPTQLGSEDLQLLLRAMETSGVMLQGEQEEEEKGNVMQEDEQEVVDEEETQGQEVVEETGGEQLAGKMRARRRLGSADFSGLDAGDVEGSGSSTVLSPPGAASSLTPASGSALSSSPPPGHRHSSSGSAAAPVSSLVSGAPSSPPPGHRRSASSGGSVASGSERAEAMSRLRRASLRSLADKQGAPLLQQARSLPADTDGAIVMDAPALKHPSAPMPQAVAAEPPTGPMPLPTSEHLPIMLQPILTSRTSGARRPARMPDFLALVFQPSLLTRSPSPLSPSSLGFFPLPLVYQVRMPTPQMMDPAPPAPLIH